MREEEKEKGGSRGEGADCGEGVTGVVAVPSGRLPLLLGVFLGVLLLLAVAAAVAFQSQLLALRRELDSLRLGSDDYEGRSRNLRKRSSRQNHDEDAGIEVAHLQGALPFQHIEREGRIGPWSASCTDATFVTLRKKNTEVEISRAGIYYVYAQVYYLTSEAHNSFQILSYNGTEERRRHRSLGTCATQGRSSMGEASCHVGFAVALSRGQRLYLNQIEQNRIVHFTNGCSYFGVVLLKRNSIFQGKP